MPQKRTCQLKENTEILSLEKVGALNELASKIQNSSELIKESSFNFLLRDQTIQNSNCQTEIERDPPLLIRLEKDAAFYESSILAVILGALLTIIPTVMYRNSDRKSKSKLAFLESLDRLYIQLEELGTQYWISDYGPDSDVIALKIDSQIQLLIKMVEFSKEIMVKDHKELDQNFVELFDLATGGDYGSDTMTRDLPRARDLSAKCVSARFLLKSHLVNQK